MTRWSPDTCECVIDFTMEDDRPQIRAVVAQCAAHAGLALLDTWAAVHPENQLKNRTLGKLIERHPEHYDPRVTGLDGPAWAFDADRNVVLDTTRLTPAEHAALLKALEDDPDIDHTKVRTRRD